MYDINKETNNVAFGELISARETSGEKYKLRVCDNFTEPCKTSCLKKKCQTEATLLK